MKAAVLLRAAAVAAILLPVLPAGAQTLLLDFGNSHALTSTGASTNPAGVSGTWNTIVGDTASGIVDSTGTAQSGISLDLGQVTVASLTLKMGIATFASLDEATTGLFASGTPGSNSLYDGSGAGIGANISGLAAGTYTVYVVADRIKSSTIPETIYAGGVSAAASPATNSSTPYSLTNGTNPLNLTAYSESNANASTTAWNEGDNYISFTVTLAAGDNLFVATSGSTTAPLNMIEIVPAAVPEPSAAALLGAALLGLAALARRRTARA